MVDFSIDPELRDDRGAEEARVGAISIVDFRNGIINVELMTLCWIKGSRRSSRRKLEIICIALKVDSYTRQKETIQERAQKLYISVKSVRESEIISHFY